MLSTKYCPRVLHKYKCSTTLPRRTSGRIAHSSPIVQHLGHRESSGRITAVDRLFFFSASTTEKEEQDMVNTEKESRVDEGYKLTSKQKKALKLLSTENQPPLEKDGKTTIISEQDIEEMTDLSQAINLIRGQTKTQELEQYESKPIPWYNLLTFPSRALWRSSPKIPPSYLTNVQFDTLKRSERTSKQLRRTIENIVKNQMALGEKRERERRNLANFGSSDAGAGAKTSLETKKIKGKEKRIKPIYYKPEQSLCSLKYRLVPNYNITKRILREVQGLMGKDQFQPKKVLDVGIGVGSASAAVLDFSFERFLRENGDDSDEEDKINQPKDTYDGVEWIHGIDPSLSMRDAAQLVIKGVIEGQQDELKMQATNTTTNRRQLKNTRITLGETLTSTIDRDVVKSKGTFDLVLCSYTLCEIPNVASSLAMVAMMWEKLSPNGVAIFIEPGTPDGFNSLRSARSMLLDCCPPKPTRMEDGEFGDNMVGDEECHVIAPCTHNGTCPMIRHKRFFSKKETTNSEAGDALLDDDFDFEDKEDEDIDDGWLEEEDEDIDDEELDLDFGKEEEWVDDKLGNQPGSNDKSSSSTTIKTTDVFDSAFCSFVHGMAGGEHGKRGEKFSYLVVQKKITGDPEITKKQNNPFHDVNIVQLLSQSIQASGKYAPKSVSKMKSQYQNIKDSEKLKDLLSEAVIIEDQFVHSDEDLLGLELVRGKFDTWGRIIRAPIKKKGHVILDYCTSGRVEAKENINDPSEQEEGKIIRHKISRSQSEKAAPGMYLASRKSRWGGLWPDLDKAWLND